MSHTQQTQESQTPKVVVCPFCASTNTTCVALFGPKLLTSQYICKDCKSAFEVMKE